MTVDPASTEAAWRPLVQIGDISVDQHWVRTPSGSVPTGQVAWTVQDMTRQYRVIPTYAIVLAVVFFLFCFLGLLFLLVKEEALTGWLQVTVQGPGLVHSTQVPVSHQAGMMDAYARVSYAQSLTAAAQG
jgi:hypothetical protein